VSLSTTPTPPPANAVMATASGLPTTLARTRKTWPLLPLAPVLVIALGLVIAVVIGFVGLDQLRRASDEHSAAQAELLAATVSARISRLPDADRFEAMQLAARRTGAEFLVVTRGGDVVLDASLGALEKASLRTIVAQPQGEARTALGRTRFSVRPLDKGHAEQRMVVFVREPTSPEGGPAMLSALVALTFLLAGVAAVVAYAVARDATQDVDFVTQRVRGMARVRTEPTGEPVPIRTLDEIGALTSAFNDLVGRFAASERAYRDDLERARSADRDRASFLAAMSHELRSPLNAILGFADILMAEVDGPLTANAREEVEQIRGSGAHLLELINDILEFSALESGQLRLTRTRVDVTALAGEVVREVGGLLAQRPVQVRVLGEAGVIANADARRVRQILTNLVGNAVKFTQSGEVVIAVERQGSYAMISVRDTGPGISAAERAMVFEEYKQAADERKLRRGTGLGLAIARRLVLMHGGRIQVESELGQGSTFRVFLPLGAPTPPPASTRMRRARKL